MWTTGFLSSGFAKIATVHASFRSVILFAQQILNPLPMETEVANPVPQVLETSATQPTSTETASNGVVSEPLATKNAQSVHDAILLFQKLPADLLFSNVFQRAFAIANIEVTDADWSRLAKPKSDATLEQTQFRVCYATFDICERHYRGRAAVLGAQEPKASLELDYIDRRLTEIALIKRHALSQLRDLYPSEITKDLF
jgi:hypothetical protein